MKHSVSSLCIDVCDVNTPASPSLITSWEQGGVGMLGVGGGETRHT